MKKIELNQIINNLDLLEKQAAELFYILMDNKELTYFEMLNYKNKLMNIESGIEYNLKDFAETDKKIFITALLSLVGCVVSLIGTFVFLFISFPVSMLFFITSYIVNIFGRKIIEKNQKENEKIKNKAEKFKNLIFNCSMLITKYENKSMNKLIKENDKDILSFYLANMLIQQYLNSPFLIDIPMEFPKQEKDIMVSILQTELKTNEVDIIKLLKTAYNVYSGENRIYTSEDTISLARKND